MTCAEVLEVLSDFVDDELDEGTRAQVIEHVRGCDWCATFGGRFAAVVAALRRELRDPGVLEQDIAARLRARLEKDDLR